MTTTIEYLQSKWKMITNSAMPETVSDWKYSVIEAALRLWMADLVYWDEKQNRLRLSRKPTESDTRHWNDIVVCDVVL